MKYHRHKQALNHKKQIFLDKKNSDSTSEKDTVEVYTLSTDAKGIARLGDGSIVFIEDLLPSERALIKIHTQKSTYKRASVLHREQDSEYRAVPSCIYYKKCGGCQLQHIKPEKQPEYKIQWFFESLKRLGKWDTEHIKLAQKNFSVVYLKNHHYRRRIRLHFDGKKLGFNENESHDIIDIHFCYIARPRLNEKINLLKNKLIFIYQELQKNLLIPNFEFDIELTESDDERVIINIVNINSPYKLTQDQSKKIKDALYKNLEIVDDQVIHLKHPQIGKFKLKKESFVQPHFNSLNSYYEHISNCVNKFISALDKKYSAKNIQRNDYAPLPLIAWDLYAGSGFFSCIPYFSAQKYNFEIQSFAVEGVKESIDSLKLTYKDLPIQGVLKDVHEFIEEQFNALNSIRDVSKKAHIIILDPPRCGVGIPNMQKIVELSAVESCVLYLACDPASFARDSQILLEGGFHNKEIFLFDSFAQTNFYEVLGFFVRG